MCSSIRTNNYKYSLFFFLLFTGIHCLSAQSKFSATAGWGYYELVNIGGQWNISDISSLSLYGGTNPRRAETKSWSAGLSFDQTFRKPVFWKLKPGYSLGTLYWTSDDDLYTFKNLAFPFMALLSYPITGSISARVEGGIILNAILQSDRKQNVEAGYPQRFNGNGRVSIIYKFGVK